jgi:Putative abortive phage resistance protein AbiGi, antitoxin
VIAGAFIKTFDENEFESIYTEREWRSISPFKFEYADVSMVVLPRDGGYFERFVAEAESIGLPKTVSIVAWEDLVEH